MAAAVGGAVKTTRNRLPPLAGTAGLPLVKTNSASDGAYAPAKLDLAAINMPSGGEGLYLKYSGGVLVASAVPPLMAGTGITVSGLTIAIDDTKVARKDTGQTFVGNQSITGTLNVTGSVTIPTAPAGTASGVAASTLFTSLAVSARTESIIVAAGDETTALKVAAGLVTFRMPYAMTLTAIKASLTTAQTGGSLLTLDVKEAGTTIFQTKPTFNNGSTTTVGASTVGVINDINLADDAVITIDVTQIGDGTAKGLKVTLIGYRP